MSHSKRGDHETDRDRARIRIVPEVDCANVHAKSKFRSSPLTQYCMYAIMQARKKKRGLGSQSRALRMDGRWERGGEIDTLTQIDEPRKWKAGDRSGSTGSANARPPAGGIDLAEGSA